MRARKAASKLEAADRAWMFAVPETAQPQIARGIEVLGELARGSVLWLGLSAVMLVFGHRRLRWAAAQGIASLLISMAAAHGVKHLVERRRPPRQLFRKTSSSPSSHSFPSSHAATGAAFVASVGSEVPQLAPLVGAAALAVGYSRMHARVHFPLDVLGGWLLGGIIGRGVHQLADGRAVRTLLRASGNAFNLGGPRRLCQSRGSSNLWGAKTQIPTLGSVFVLVNQPSEDVATVQVNRTPALRWVTA